MLDCFVCYLKLSFSKVFVVIQNVFCVEQVVAVFCVVSCVNTVPRHVQDRFLMAGGWGRNGGEKSKAPSSNFCLVLRNNSILVGSQDDIWFPQSQHALPQITIFFSPKSTSQKAEMSFCKMWWHMNYFIILQKISCTDCRAKVRLVYHNTLKKLQFMIICLLFSVSVGICSRRDPWLHIRPSIPGCWHFHPPLKL